MIELKVIRGMAGDAAVTASLEYCRHVLCAQLAAIALLAGAPVHSRGDTISLGSFGVLSRPLFEALVYYGAIFSFAWTPSVGLVPRLVERGNLFFIGIAPFLVSGVRARAIFFVPFAGFLVFALDPLWVALTVFSLGCFDFLRIFVTPAFDVIATTNNTRSGVRVSLGQMTLSTRLASEVSDKLMRLRGMAVDYLHVTPRTKEILA